MKKFKIMACSLLVFALCCSFCGCGGSGAKYKVQYTDGSVHQLTSKKIIELYNQEPTRDNPNNVIYGAIISGIGTVTDFSCVTDTSTKIYSTGEYYQDQYTIEIDDKLVIVFTTKKDGGVKLQLYTGDKVNFSGEIYGASSFDNCVQIMPKDGSYLAEGSSAGITLVK